MDWENEEVSFFPSAGTFVFLCIMKGTVPVYEKEKKQQKENNVLAVFIYSVFKTINTVLRSSAGSCEVYELLIKQT